MCPWEEGQRGKENPEPTQHGAPSLAPAHDPETPDWTQRRSESGAGTPEPPGCPRASCLCAAAPWGHRRPSLSTQVLTAGDPGTDLGGRHGGGRSRARWQRWGPARARAPGTASLCRIGATVGRCLWQPPRPGCGLAALVPASLSSGAGACPRLSPAVGGPPLHSIRSFPDWVVRPLGHLGLELCQARSPSPSQTRTDGSSCRCRHAVKETDRERALHGLVA